MTQSHRISPVIIGWREWVGLPQLGIGRIKAKIDTGARTSALHAFDCELFQTRKKISRLRFAIHPIQKEAQTTLHCEADLVDKRWVIDSGGHRELRFVIHTKIAVGNFCWLSELTLTNRATMGFRMLLGRSAMKKRFIVDPSHSFLTSR